jgi:hypothetical protein
MFSLQGLRASEADPGIEELTGFALGFALLTQVVRADLDDSSRMNEDE